MGDREGGVLRRVEPADVARARDFLREADLTLAGLDSPAVRLWVEHDDGQIVGSTGFELSADEIAQIDALEAGNRTGADPATADFTQMR